jgi:hypothetical protein
MQPYRIKKLCVLSQNVKLMKLGVSQTISRPCPASSGTSTESPSCSDKVMNLSFNHFSYYCRVCVLLSVVDPHWLQCGSGSSFFSMRIRIQFFLNADPDTGSQTNTDSSGSGSRSDFKLKKVEFLH